MQMRHGFTLVEMLIVVVLLGILATLVVPKFASASDDAKETQVLTDTQTIRGLIQLYTVHHNGRAPHLDENGSAAHAHFRDRLLQKTDQNGKLNPAGAFGPYLKIWPANSYMEGEKAKEVMIGAARYPPGDESTGWYYSTTTELFWPNSKQSGRELVPLVKLGAAAVELPGSGG